uniref:Glycosyltransferase 61 catalytic domain-containing protein n=1 Tax=Salix viminalis TaxID=40686 RepID=A0A6N2M0M8_SALVM
MKYQTLLARSFSKHEQKKLGYWALFLFIALSFFINFKPFMGPLSVCNEFEVINGEDEKLHLFDDTDSSLQIAKETINSTSIVNDTGSSHEEAEIMSSALTVNDTDSSHGESEIREIIVNNATSRSQEVVVFKESLAQIMKTNDSSNPPQFVNEKDTSMVNNTNSSLPEATVSSEIDILTAENTSWCIRPYARKGDQAAMGAVREWTVKLVAGASHILPQCTQKHSVPAILFSAGGYSGNHFHSFADIIVPLFITSRPYNGDVQFLITNGIIIEDSLIVNDTSNSQEIATAADAAAMDEKTELRCNIMGRSEFCEMKGDIRIDGNSSTAFIVSSETDILTAENTSWSIRPYARKEALGEKDFARKWSVKPVTSRLDIARYTRNHSVPAILFSAGGYSGNFFHAFTDIIIPLYSTARTFNREVQFLMTDRKPWWIAKFKTLFEALSRYGIIDIDDRHDVHCFHSLTVGLKGRNNKELSIDSSTSPYSMKDFRKFLRSWYSLKKITAAIIRDGDKRKPRLLIIPRKRSRSFTNVGEIAQLAESLSYQVIVAEPGPDVSGFAKIINSCDVLMGVHGAGLTNIVFLPENAILIQVVPFGKVEWASRISFEDPAKDMNIRYLDYKIKVEESTLIQQYPADHEVLRDPSAIGKQGWVAFRSIYLDKQNVMLDVERFRPTLYQTLLARSFSKHEQKKLGYWALLACLFIALSFFINFKPFMGPLSVLNLRLSTGEDEKLHLFDDTDSSLQIAKETINSTSIVNDTGSSHEEAEIMSSALTVNDTDSSHGESEIRDASAGTKNRSSLCTFMGRSDFCEIKGDIRIDGNSYTVFIVSSEINILAAENTSWCIRPYARKGEWTVKLVAGASHILPQCTQNHSVPAILFSAGGYSGNHFHSFADIIVPLFLTSRPYNGDVQFLITNVNANRYQPISIDYRQDIHCYDSMTVGLIRRTSKELSIDPSNSPYSMKDFRQFLRSSYSLKRTTAIKIGNGSRKRPRLVIISRKRSRAFTNVGEIVSMAKRLGFRVVVAEPDADVSGFAKIINSCDVMMGVHGAGLTNMVFLPEKAVLVQVIPIGGTEWLSKTYFEEPVKDMNIRYLDYKIRLEESTLIHQYPPDHVVLRDPSAVWKQGWSAVQSIYLSKQNVTLDVNRFRPTLVKALELLHQ